MYSETSSSSTIRTLTYTASITLLIQRLALSQCCYTVYTTSSTSNNSSSSTYNFKYNSLLLYTKDLSFFLLFIIFCRYIAVLSLTLLLLPLAGYYYHFTKYRNTVYMYIYIYVLYIQQYFHIYTYAVYIYMITTNINILLCDKK